ncbi:MAG: hypothetical protein PHC88_16130 [Terrimicrobiaceae bacterium]|nr:hypothetical protein [Terrimicrobiaceae bacterium]
MAYIASLNPNNPYNFPEIPIERPVTLNDLAKRLNLRPFQVVKDLMEFNHFAAPTHELPDEVVLDFGLKHRVFFKIKNSA